MRCTVIDAKSDEMEFKYAAELLAETLDDNAPPMEVAELEAFARRAVTSGTNARFLLLYDDNNQPGALCSFNLCCGVDGDYVWINSFHIRDEEFAASYGDFLGKELFKWAKEKGCVRVAGAAEKTDYEIRQLADKLGMEQKRLLLLELRL